MKTPLSSILALTTACLLVSSAGGCGTGLASLDRDESSKVNETDEGYVSKRVVPIVRSESVWTTVDSQMSARDDEPSRMPRMPYVGPLSVGFGFDHPTFITLASGESLTSWKGRQEALLQIAVENLRQKDPMPFQRHPQGFVISAHDDGLDTSRILLVDAIRALKMPSAPLAIIVSKELLILVPEGDLVAFVAATAFGAAAADSNDESCESFESVLRLGDKGWELYKPTAEHLNAHVAAYWTRHVEARKRARSVNEVPAPNTPSGARTHQRAFLKVFGSRDGRLKYLTGIASGIPTLLPQADVVMLLRTKGTGDDLELNLIGYVDFDVFQRVAGDRMTKDSDSAKLWRVTMSLDDTDLKALAPREKPFNDGTPGAGASSLASVSASHSQGR